MCYTIKYYNNMYKTGNIYKNDKNYDKMYINKYKNIRGKYFNYITWRDIYENTKRRNSI